MSVCASVCAYVHLTAVPQRPEEHPLPTEGGVRSSHEPPDVSAGN